MYSGSGEYKPWPLDALTKFSKGRKKMTKKEIREMKKSQNYVVQEILEMTNDEKRVCAFRARGVKEARKKFRQWYPNRTERARYKLYKLVEVV